MATDDDEYGTPRRVRMSDEDWSAFLDATKAMFPEGRSPRGPVLRQFVQWYLRRPGAKLPERPPAGPWSTPPQT
ncbi:hypothetical protein [Streptomyces sp. 900105755]